MALATSIRLDPLDDLKQSTVVDQRTTCDLPRNCRVLEVKPENDTRRTYRDTARIVGNRCLTQPSPGQTWHSLSTEGVCEKVSWGSRSKPEDSISLLGRWILFGHVLEMQLVLS